VYPQKIPYPLAATSLTAKTNADEMAKLLHPHANGAEHTAGYFVPFVTYGQTQTRHLYVLDTYNDRWALVTGASSGIGREFAERLAGHGMHLILAARRTEQMNELAQELLTRHGTTSHIVTIDLATLDAGQRLHEEIQRLNVDVELVINNAGAGLIGDVETTDPHRVRRMLTLNILTLTDLTYRLLPGMLERGHGAIINMSSVAAFQPVAFMGAYSASKSFILHFSEALWSEVRGRGVTVMALCPGVTETEFFTLAGAPGWLQKHTAQTPSQVVRKALKGLEKRRQYLITSWKDYLITMLVRMTTRRAAVNESKRYFRPGRRLADDELAEQTDEDGVAKPNDHGPA
jgi:short-subunit dehydrogenase